MSGAEGRIRALPVWNGCRTRPYARRLSALSGRVNDRLMLIMRVYFEKPRTTVGWKGLINDPHLDGSYDIESGLKQARKLLLEISELGLPAGTEFLDSIVPGLRQRCGAVARSLEK